MKTYKFSGSVFSYGDLMMRNWSGETTAATREKAEANLKHRFRKTYGLQPTKPLVLCGEWCIA